MYILRSEADPSRHYVGVASNPRERLDWHNGGPRGYTVAHRPWSIAVSIEFPTEKEARRFEGYLKSGSGRAFANGTSHPSATASEITVGFSLVVVSY